MIQVETIITDFGKHTLHDSSVNKCIAELETAGNMVIGVSFEHIGGVRDSKTDQSVGIRLLAHIIYDKQKT